MAATEKEKKSLSDTVAKILEKEGIKIYDLEDESQSVKEFISTGSTVLDYCIANKRNGGIPVGRITEIVGEEASGKSLLATHILANTQKKGGIAFLLDTEHTFDPHFAERLGLDTKKCFKLINPSTIEECYATIESIIKIVRAKENLTCPVTIVWDSTAATPCEKELEGDYNPSSDIGLAARVHAKGMKKITGSVGVEKITLVLCNQLKMKIDMSAYSPGPKWTTPGGKAAHYHTSARIKLKKGKHIEEVGEKAKDKHVVGVHTVAEVFKNKLGPSFRKCEFDIKYANGINDVESIRDYLWDYKGVITKANGWMKIKDQDGKEIKFQASTWPNKMKDPVFRDHVLNLLEEVSVIKYNLDDNNFIMDEESGIISLDKVKELKEQEN